MTAPIPRPFQSACLFILSAAAFLNGTEPPKNIISSRTVNVGTHSVTIQRIEPPIPVAAISKSSTSSPTFETNVPGSQNYGAPTSLLHKTRTEVLSLSCTRYECGVTEVRWSAASGGECRILSSIDFNYLRNTGAFDDSGRSYAVFMGVGTAQCRQV